MKLGDVCKFINGDRGKNYPSQHDISNNGEVPFINAGHIVEGNIDLSAMNYISLEKYTQLNSGKIKENDILYCLRGSLGKKALVRNISVGAIASSLVIIRPDTEKADSEYLFYALESPTVQRQMLQANNGSSQPNLSAKSVSEYEFLLPNIKAQREVVAKMQHVNRLIVCRKKQLSKLDELIKARFVELFGTIHDNKFGYEIKTLQDVCEQIKDGTHQTPIYTDDSVNGYKFLSSKDVTTGKIDWTHLKYIPEELHNELYARIAPRKGDILLAKNGTTGIAAIVDKDEIFDIYVSLALLRPIEINSVYLWAAINSVETKQQFDSSLKGIGVPNLHLGEIKKARIIVPPMDEQKRFATFVEQTDKSKLEVQKSLEKLELLKKALMQKYFG